MNINLLRAELDKLAAFRVVNAKSGQTIVTYEGNGRAERRLIDAAKVAREMGYDVCGYDVHQRVLYLQR